MYEYLRLEKKNNMNSIKLEIDETLLSKSFEFVEAFAKHSETIHISTQDIFPPHLGLSIC
jgi:hypothetical protein